MTTVARAVLEITTDSSGVDTGIGSIKAKVGTLATDLKGLAGTMGLAFGGAAVVSGLKNLITGTFEYAENISDLSSKMGVSTDAAQRWKFAAEQSGGSLEVVDKAVTKLSLNLAGGDKSVVSALESAGLKFDAIRQMKPEDAFNATVAAVAKIPDPMEQARVATELFGKAGAELLPAIRNGFSDVAREASVMSEQTIKDLDAAKDAWSNLGNQITIWTGQAIGGISRAGEAVGGWLSRMSVWMSDGSEGLKRYDEAAADLARTQDRLNKEQDAGAASAAKAADAARKKAEADAEGERKAKASAAEQERLAKAFQAQVDVLTGKAISNEVKEIARQVEAAGKQGGLTRYQYEELNKRLDDLKSKGASLPPVLQAIWLEHQKINPSIKLTTDLYKNLNDVLSTTSSIKLTLPPPPPPLNIPLNVMSPQEIIDQVNLNLATAGRPTNIALGAKPLGQAIGISTMQALSESLADIPNVILGALQGGGSVMASIGSAIGGALFGPNSGLNKLLNDGLSKVATKIGGGFVANLATSLSAAIPGLGALLGPMIGDLAGKALGWLGGALGFKSNDTKKMREQFASEMGMTLSQLYDDLRKKFGAEGETLANTALNVIGRKDIAAQQAWFKEVETLYAKYKRETDDAADATEEAATREAEAHKKVTDAIQSKIDKVSDEYDSVFKGIEEELNNPEYDEEGNRIYGVEEARGLARLEQLQKEKDALQAQMEDAKKLQDEVLTDSQKKITDAAGVIRTGIEEIFKDPIRITFDVPRVTLPGGGSYGGSTSGVVGTSSAALWSQSVRPVVVNAPPVYLDGRLLNANQRRYRTEDWERG